MDHWFEELEKENHEDFPDVVVRPDVDLSSLPWTDLVSFASDRIVYLSPQTDCGICSDTDDSPMELPYKLTVSAAFSHRARDNHDPAITRQLDTSTSKTTSLHLIASTAEATARPLSQLFSCMTRELERFADEPCLDVTLKAFATNPRQRVATLATPEISQVYKLQLEFCALDEVTTYYLFNSVGQIELKQCAMPCGDGQSSLGWGHALRQASRLDTLYFSGTQADLRTIGFGLTPSDRLQSSLRHLHVVCHAWLMGPVWNEFCHGLTANQSLESLSITYLDIGDGEWMLLMQALHQHPCLKQLKLQFTDSFVDATRRMTPERREIRSRAVWELVQTNRNIQVIEWPICQHDEAVWAQIQEALRER